MAPLIPDGVGQAPPVLASVFNSAPSSEGTLVPPSDRIAPASIPPVLLRRSIVGRILTDQPDVLHA
jgi:hypothetical protein